MLDIFVIPFFRLADPDSPTWEFLAKYIKVHHSAFAAQHSPTQVAIRKMADCQGHIVRLCQPDYDSLNKLTSKDVDDYVLTYIFTLRDAMKHLPLGGEKESGSNIANISYKWSILSDPKESFYKLESNDANFHIASLLSFWSICLCVLGVKAMRDGSAESVKKTFKYMQEAAGAVEAAETYAQKMKSDLRRGDLSKLGIKMCKKLYLAYAHHCAFLKVLADSPTNHRLLSKLAMQGYDNYIVVSSAVVVAENANAYSNRIADVKMSLYTAFMASVMKSYGYYYGAKYRMDETEAGIAIALVNKAITTLESCMLAQVSKELREELVSGLLAQCREYFGKCVRENDMVYRKAVPKEPEDPLSTGKSLGKPVFNEGGSSDNGKVPHVDAFQGIVPHHVSEIVNSFRDKVRTLVRLNGESVQNHKKRIHDSLNLLNAVAVVETMLEDAHSQEKSKYLPESLRERIIALRKKAAQIEGELVPQLTGHLFIPKQPVGTEDNMDGAAVTTLVDLLHLVTKKNDSNIEFLVSIEKIVKKAQTYEVTRREMYGVPLWESSCRALESMQEFVSCKLAAAKLRGDVEGLKDSFEILRLHLQESVDEICRVDWPLNDLHTLLPFRNEAYITGNTSKIRQLVSQMKTCLKSIEDAEKAIDERRNVMKMLIESEELAQRLCSVPKGNQDTILDTSYREVSGLIDEVTTQMDICDTAVNEIQDCIISLASQRSTDSTMANTLAICTSLEKAVGIVACGLQQVSEMGICAQQLCVRLRSIHVALEDAVASYEKGADDVAMELDAELAKKITEMKKIRGK